MVPTMTLDTISKIRMVLAVWLMVMRRARWAVFSVQMSFESFRIGTIYLKSRDIVTDKVFLQASSRLLPTCPKLSSTIPMLVYKNSTTFLVSSTTSLQSAMKYSYKYSSQFFLILTGLKIREAIPQNCSCSRLEVQELRQKFSSRRMRLKVKILVLVSEHEIDEKKSRSRLET